jgi:hypothetical protein
VAVIPKLLAIEKNKEFTIEPTDFSRFQIKFDFFCFEIGLYPNGLYGLVDVNHSSCTVLDLISRNPPLDLNIEKVPFPFLFNQEKENQIYLIESIKNLVDSEPNKKMFYLHIPNGIIMNPPLVVPALDKLLFYPELTRAFTWLRNLTKNVPGVALDAKKSGDFSLAFKTVFLDCFIASDFSSKLKIEFIPLDSLSNGEIALNQEQLNILTRTVCRKVKINKITKKLIVI